MKKLSLERIYSALISLGLSEVDAKVYINLAMKGLARARKIVNDLGINKRQIYRSLKLLEQKGIIMVSDEHPAEFSALPFEEVLDMLIELKEEQAKDVKKRRKELLSSWKANGK